MKVKIGNRIYSSEEQPIMLILSDEEKQNIGNMPPDANRYCSYPYTEKWCSSNFKKIKEWMSEITEMGSE